ncbi:GntR family transcriptional regulator [Elioraea sp.]|uniref:GntR family transcriptional regulator n=1 Tax=Elioraea sp. TaxID=2185103 RepID=UPI0025C6DF08|nr:GntR family transcriptional regulator [Elioraea sp.]
MTAIPATTHRGGPGGPPTSETLATAAYRRLRADIVEGRLAPGLKLKVHELARRYGAGPAPLREALAQLTAEGLAVRMEQRGFRVRALDPRALGELVRTRCLVEGLALRESILRGDAAWENAIAGSAHRLASLPVSLAPDRFIANPAWEAAHRAFHRALIDACEAAPLIDFCERLREEADRYRTLSSVASYPQRDVPAEHAAIARAALDRDAERAPALLAEHLARTGDVVRLGLKEGPEPAFRRGAAEPR